MTHRIEENTRGAVAEFLPDAIEKTLESYRAFVAKESSPEEAKEFSAHHTAAKVAIAHLELLLKLARWADVEHAEQGRDKHFHKIIEEAQKEIIAYTEKTQN